MPFCLYSDQADPGTVIEQISCTRHLGRTGNVTADDGLQRYHLGLLHQHRAALELRLVWSDILGHLVDVRRDEVVGDDVPQFVEPEE